VTDIEQIFQAIRGLPVRERLRLVERVVRDVADAPPEEEQDPDAGGAMLGLFADDPDGVDDMMETVMEMRHRSRLRAVGGRRCAELSLTLTSCPRSRRRKTRASSTMRADISRPGADSRSPPSR